MKGKSFVLWVLVLAILYIISPVDFVPDGLVLLAQLSKIASDYERSATGTQTPASVPVHLSNAHAHAS
jgi:hypothetical protein